MTIIDVRFSDWIQKGVSLFTGNAAVLLVCGVTAVLITGVTLGLLAGPMLAGMAIIVLNLQDERLSRPSINDLFKGFDYTIATIPVTLAFYGLMLFHMVVHLIPLVGQVINSIVISVGLAIGVLSVFHLVARKVTPRESAPVWWSLFVANWGPLLGFFILTMLIGIAGFLAFVVGLAVTVPIYLSIMGVAYLAILRQSAEL